MQESDGSITRMQAIVEPTPKGNPEPPPVGQLDNTASLVSLALGSHFNRRYERSGNLQDLEEAIKGTEVAVKAIAKDHPDRAACLVNLGIHLSSRYQRTGDLHDLECAITYAVTAVETTPEGHRDRGACLASLGSHLKRRYERTGNVQDLEAAINHTEAAVKATQEDNPDRAGWLNNLGNHLNRLYERTGNLQDLEAAIARSETAVEKTPEDHQDRARLLNNLGYHLNTRYNRTGDRQDLEAAIKYAETAVKATPQDHPGRAAWLNSLSSYLHGRHERTGNFKDLEAAIDHADAAVQATPDDHPSRALRLNHLSSYLSRRYERLGNRTDLEVAINHAKRALEAIPEDHPDRAGLLNNLGHYLRHRHKQTARPEDLKLAIAAWVASWSMPTAPILIRIQAASSAAETLVFSPSANFNDLTRACSLLHDATHLIPLATSRSLEREDQQYILGQLTGLASLAAAVSLYAGQAPLEALRLVELGRSVTNGQLLDYRSDISDLMEQHPTLAKDFDSLRHDLDSPLPGIESFSSESSPDTPMDKRQQILVQQAALRTRNKVAQDLDDILQQIRQKPRFQAFLRAESEEYVLSAAQGGPIVVLNGTKLRSDAILLTKERVTSIPLPELSYASMIKQLGININDNKVKREMLEWLWDAAVQPVLMELGFYPQKVDPLPRIWWIGVGLMAQAPIHAATKFTRWTVKIKMTTLQYCLPSYTSTIRALQYSRSRQRYQQNTSMLIVTMPTTPGVTSLSCVTHEAGEIKRSLRDFSKVEILEMPTAEYVLHALSGYSIAHFACHGVSSSNPSDSHLLLLKGTGDLGKLRVKDIAALKLPLASARLAYLSACSTAHSASSKLVDEATHIVSSFHIAGYINVIGTLWLAEDQACSKMSAEFYSMLGKTDNVAVSYRNAILGLMTQKPSQPMYWAPFILFGA